MELHLSATKPDWADVPLPKRNSWQHIAALTKGVVTPGNILSVVGVGLVLAGLWEMWDGQYWNGLVLIAIGRICDLIDGAIAHATGTKSPLGEATDASCDKIGALATLMVFGAAGWLWWLVALLIGLQNLVNSLIGLIGRERKYRLHPLPAGKISTAGEWVGLLGFAFVAALGLDHLSALGIAFYAILIASLALGLYATAGYFKSFLSQRNR
jgi:phosphatidylglycerophosphate synthase